MMFSPVIRRRCELRRCQHHGSPLFIVLGRMRPANLCGPCRDRRNALIRKFWIARSNGPSTELRALSASKGKGVLA